MYQVVHEGVVKVAKKTNLARLGVGRHGVDRVFKRFVKELYILSQMHSERFDGSDSIRTVDGMNVVGYWCTVGFPVGFCMSSSGLSMFDSLRQHFYEYTLHNYRFCPPPPKW